MRYTCQTLFDITPTGVTGHFKSARLPFTDQVGQPVQNFQQWTHSRNQQRNWETLTQIVGMRAQLFNLTSPSQENLVWTFEFAVESNGIFGLPDDPTRVLREDAEGVPMLVDLTNKSNILPVLTTQGSDQNIWFYVLP